MTFCTKLPLSPDELVGIVDSEFVVDFVVLVLLPLLVTFGILQMKIPMLMMFDGNFPFLISSVALLILPVKLRHPGMNIKYN